MPRRLKVATRELGFVELFVVYSKDGAWEPDWRPLQGTHIADLFTVLSKAAYDHVLRGYSRPFVDALGLEPKGVLHKLTPSHRCHNQVGCTFYEKKDCYPLGRNLPHCYQPSGLSSDEARSLGYEAVRLWREGVYMVVVQEGTDAG